MGKTKTLLAVAVAAASIASAGMAEELHLFNWGDYINPDVLTKFTAETGIKVTLDTYSSNDEMLAKLQAGATGYDIVFPSVYMMDVMLKLGLLEKTGINTHPGFANIDPVTLRSQQDPKGEYCLPYAWGSVGIFYNEDKTGPITGWADFFAIPGKTGGKITLLDDMREVLGVGLIMTGHSVNSTDPAEIKAATDYILAQKPNVSAFTYDLAPLLQSGDVVAGHYFVGLNVVTKTLPGMKYVIPKEGATMYQEDMCVLKTAPDKDAALKFLDFYMRPEIAVLNVEQQYNGTANKAAVPLIPDEIRNDPNITANLDTVKRLQIFSDLGAAVKLYDRAWNTIRTAQ